MKVQEKKIKVITEHHKGGEEVLLDCSKLGDPMQTGHKLIQHFGTDKTVWIFIDSDFTYVKKIADAEVNMKQVLKCLEDNQILFESKEKMVEKADMILGIPMKKKKIKHYRIAVKAAEGALAHLSEIFDYTSMFCYICDDRKSFEEIYELHDHISEMDEGYVQKLGKDGFVTFLYFDNFYRRIRIASKGDVKLDFLFHEE